MFRRLKAGLDDLKGKEMMRRCENILAAIITHTFTDIRHGFFGMITMK